MLTTRQPVLRRFWYALVPMSHLDDGPKPFRLIFNRNCFGSVTNFSGVELRSWNFRRS